MVPKNTGVRGTGGLPLTEPLQLHDIGLRANVLDERALSTGTTNSRFCGGAIEDCADRPPAGALNHEKDTREDDAKQKADDKVEAGVSSVEYEYLHGHSNCNHPDGDVFHTIDTIAGVPDSLFSANFKSQAHLERQVDTQNKD